MALKVCELFLSIQGESTWSGLPCGFIRLSGCNLNCRWCDTEYAKTEASYMDMETLLTRVDNWTCSLVEVTGGEPLLQPGTPDLIRRLLDRGRTVLLETNGSLDIGTVDTRCVRIMDIKCPGSGEAQSFLSTNLDNLTPRDEVKFVLTGEEDYRYARSFIDGGSLSALPQGHIHLSPVTEELPPALLAGWMIRDAVRARLSLQLHKTIWDPDRRGV